MTTIEKITRRKFVRSAGTLAGGVVAASLTGINVLSAASRKKSDIRIDRISQGYDEDIFRAPVGFAGSRRGSGHESDREMFC
jgi:hypothetical protein